MTDAEILNQPQNPKAEVSGIPWQIAELQRQLKMPQGLCPTCGQEIPREKFIAERDAKLAQIVAEGKNSAKDIADFKKILSAFEDELKLERAKPVADENRLATLDRDISALERDLAKVESAAGIKDRIKTLATREKKLNQLIATLEGQIKIAENFQQRKIELVEENISANFEFVRFKLFDYFITTGEIKTTCEAMLDGVPYSALSKGEKLKAALDIFKALQKHFGTDLPLIIDDAESYTQNSFVELPNQIFLCKVSDDDLIIIDNSFNTNLPAEHKHNLTKLFGKLAVAPFGEIFATPFNNEKTLITYAKLDYMNSIYSFYRAENILFTSRSILQHIFGNVPDHFQSELVEVIEQHLDELRMYANFYGLKG